METLSDDQQRFKGLILLVEDEEPIRKIAQRILARLGFTVLEAADMQQALSHWHQHQDKIDLLFTDIILPQKRNGLELAENCLKEKPSLKIIISSGYFNESIIPKSLRDPLIAYLQKPYDIKIMIDAVSSCFKSSPQC